MRVKKSSNWKYVVMMMLAMVLSCSAMTAVTQAATTHTASATTDRKDGVCTYTVKGLDPSRESEFTMELRRSDNKQTMIKKQIRISEDNCVNGTYEGNITLADAKYICTSYSVHILVGTEDIKAGVCDFSIHRSRMRMLITGKSTDSARTFQLVSTEPEGGVLAPGSGNKVKVYAWQKNKSESTAKEIGGAKNLAGSSLKWTEKISKAGSAYGTWCAKIVLENENWSQGITVAQSEYKVEPLSGTLTVQKSASLEKKKSFKIVLSGFQSVSDVKQISFPIYNSAGKKVYTAKASKSGKKYVATVKLKKLKNKLGLYTVKAVYKNTGNVSRTLTCTALADERAKGGKFKIKVRKDASSKFTLSGAYLPGNIKKVTFVVYKNGKKKQGTYKAVLASKKYSAVVKSKSTGKYVAYAYGYTAWGKKILLNKKSYSVGKKHMGKQGWRYEKYNGKTYKFYYINNERQTNLTKILKLKKGSGRYTIELNRAAGVVTVYMYDTKTKSYDIPVQAFSVSVGRDVSTNAGPGALALHSSYTPLGNFSVCSNGQAVRYTLKPMHEPDGSTVYARWAVHIVGNVYFHAIAVGGQSHYSLNPNTYNRLGSPASAGCIRMTVADAKWLYDYVPTGTPIKIKQGNSKKPGPLGKPATIKVTGSIHYDPTDPQVPNSRKKADYKANRISGYMTKSGKKVGY